MKCRTCIVSVFLAALAFPADAKPPADSGGDGASLTGSAEGFDVSHGNSGFDRKKVVPGSDGSLPITTKSDDPDDPPKLTDDPDEPPSHSGSLTGSLDAAANDLASVAAGLHNSSPPVRLSFPVKDSVNPWLGSAGAGSTGSTIAPPGGTIPAPSSLLVLTIAAAVPARRRR